MRREACCFVFLKLCMAPELRTRNPMGDCFIFEPDTLSHPVELVFSPCRDQRHHNSFFARSMCMFLQMTGDKERNGDCLRLSFILRFRR